MNELTNCKACGKEIAKVVKKCIHCGKDQRNFFMKHKIFTVSFVIFFLCHNLYVLISFLTPNIHNSMKVLYYKSTPREDALSGLKY